MNCCPRCEGGAGYTFHVIERVEMSGEWGAKPTTERNSVVTTSLVKCVECEGVFRFDKLRAAGGIRT